MREHKRDPWFVLESTRTAFMHWINDYYDRRIDEERFPHHKHGPHDYWHDQLQYQDYYQQELPDLERRRKEDPDPNHWHDTIIERQRHNKKQQQQLAS